MPQYKEFDFGTALTFLKDGHRVKRRKWKKTNYLYIFLFKGEDNKEKICMCYNLNSVYPYNIEWNSISYEDLLANDWEVTII